MLYLAGGGDEKDSVKLDQQFAEDVGGKKLLYLPIAMSGVSPTYEECHTWIQRVFNPLGITDIVMWDALTPNLINDLGTFDAVYIGGGNTYKLLDHLRKTGFDHPLKDFIANGGSVYGGSAGAIVLGRDISTCSVMDTNEVGLDDTTGLGLVGNYAIWCHYVDAHDNFIANYDYPIIAIPERSGISFDGSIIRVIGFDAVTIFDRGFKRVLMPNEKMSVFS
ncbi:Type 1 glutamine amidotransferase-like domain-containing protein [Alicyclobacillus acidiphilus]|uniref:Type 1 glutamine amidotransferase-like domain-containing protein n=1 Tax=Alicyclobacillus acidiphilus TaxID=182455 RepID=UPI0008373889|nr:Type 1 glutamine amidotransferase-like domain-containing protein [Alicyclobacillus acidiphilus]